MSSKKMGRPTDERKPKDIHIRLSEEDYEFLTEYSKQQKKNSQDIIREFIKSLRASQ